MIYFSVFTRIQVQLFQELHGIAPNLLKTFLVWHQSATIELDVDPISCGKMAQRFSMCGKATPSQRFFRFVQGTAASGLGTPASIVVQFRMLVTTVYCHTRIDPHLNPVSWDELLAMPRALPNTGGDPKPLCGIQWPG